MTAAARVLLAIDEAMLVAQVAPVLFARVARAGGDVVDVVTAYDTHRLGRPPILPIASGRGVRGVQMVAFLDAPGTTRRAERRHAANRRARAARRMNRSR